MSSEVNVSELVNFVLRDSGMHVNIAIGIAYVSVLTFLAFANKHLFNFNEYLSNLFLQAIFGGLAWFVLSQLGEPSSTRRKEQGGIF